MYGGYQGIFNVTQVPFLCKRRMVPNKRKRVPQTKNNEYNGNMKGLCGYEVSISQIRRQKTSLKNKQHILGGILGPGTVVALLLKKKVDRLSSSVYVIYYVTC